MVVAYGELVKIISQNNLIFSAGLLPTKYKIFDTTLALILVNIDNI